MSGVSPHANMSSGGDAQVPPPSKKPKLDGDSAPPPAAGTHLTPAAPPPAAAHSLPMMPLMPVGTSASFPGGISLTISNGMINMQKAGGQGDGAPPHGLTVVKGDNSGSMCQLSTPVQGVLKIPAPRPLQLRMAGGRAGFKATRHPFRPAGMVTMSPRPGVPISPQAMQMMGVAPLLQAQNRPPGHMTPGQQVTAIHPLAGTVIPASSVTAKIDPNNPTNGQHSSTHKDPAKRREQLIASKPPAGTVPIGKAAVVKSVSPASSQGGAQAKSPTGPHGTQLKQVQVASSRPPHLSVVQGQPMPRVPASIPQFSVVRSQAAPLASPRPPQLSLVRTHAPSLLSPQSVGVSNAPPPPLSIIHGQPVQAMSSSAQLSLLQGQHSPMLSPQPTFVMTHHPGQGKPPGMAVMVPTSQVSLAGLKPRAPVSMVITAPSTAQPKVVTSSAVEQKPASTSPAQPECVTTTGQPSAPAEPAPTQRSPDKSPAQPAQSTEPVAPDSTIEPSTPNPPDTPTTDFDPVDAMTWENGVGSLPGSELKFRMNEFGMMEMITDDPALDTSAPLEPPTSTAENAPTEPPQTSQASAHPTTIHLEFVNKDSSAGGVTNVEIKSDEVKACANCGRYCLKNKLIKSGKFCSEECFAASSEKKGDKLTMKKPVSKDAVSLKTVESKDGGCVKKKKKKLSEAVKQEPDLDILSVKVMDTVGGKKPKGFVWSHYLDQEKAAGAPTKLFKEPFPTVRNGFKVGMRCEGIDPSHQSLFCVLSVAEVKGFRLRMRFDGYSESYDFWINADNPFLFPVGWCEKNNRTLQPPRGFSSDFEFNWGGYLKFCGGSAAPKHLFINQHTTSLTPNAFRVGQKLEAVDLKNTTLICVATVADTLGERILVHFDGWEDDYDYWCDPSSPYIHPVGWCQANAKALSPPADWQDISRFTWEEYLSQTKATAVPARAFKQRPPVGFEVGMKMEVVDRRNPILIRVASIVEVLEHKVRVHFDGWSEAYDLWVDDDSPDLHPPGWCGRTGHALQAPVYPEDLIVSPGQSGCPTPGCKGFGHIKGAKYVGHHSAFGCPYSQMNMVKEVALVDRLVSSRGDDGGATLTTKAARALDRISPEQRSCPTPGCDGSGHVTGKYAAHSKSSGCPLAQQNLLLKSKAYGKDGLKFRPGRGRGRGRKKHCKFLHWREKREKEEHSPGTSPEPGVSGAGSSLHNGIHQSVFMSAMVPNPAKDLPLCWDQHSKLLPGVDKIRGGQVASWSIHDVASFVRSLPGCKELASIFIEQQIDGEAFLLLNQTDIVKIMNIKLGPALKIYNSILMFQSSTDT